MDLKDRIFKIKDVSKTLIIFGVVILAVNVGYISADWMSLLGGFVLLIGAISLYIKNKWMRFTGGLTISIAGIAIGFSVLSFYTELAEHLQQC